MLVADDLDVLHRSSRLKSLFENGLVAPSPAIAIANIEALYSVKPNRLGTNCQGLQHLRREISILSDDDPEVLSNALNLVAPHTHWPPGPIIQTYCSIENKYWIGPQSGQSPFVAVSFVFHKDGPQPYEWADASCGLMVTQLKRLWRVIEQLNENVIKTSWFSYPFPIGISISHRFKLPFDPHTSSTHESPAPGAQNLSYIVPSGSAGDLQETNFDQVGWSAAMPPDLNHDEMESLRELESMFSEMPANEVTNILSSLKN